MTAVPELTPEQFCSRWPDKTDSDQVVLLDVREPAELQLAELQGAVRIPMREVPQRLHELDRETALVVVCHVGARSRQVAEFLLGAGFKHVFNLAGGIDACSQTIDPHVPRY